MSIGSEETLTEGEVSLLDQRLQRLEKVARICEPANFPEADNIIKSFHKKVGVQQPIILHFSSPEVCELAANFIMIAVNEKSSDRGHYIRRRLMSEKQRYNRPRDNKPNYDISINSIIGGSFNEDALVAFEAQFYPKFDYETFLKIQDKGFENSPFVTNFDSLIMDHLIQRPIRILKCAIDNQLSKHHLAEIDHIIQIKNFKRTLNQRKKIDSANIASKLGRLNEIFRYRSNGFGLENPPEYYSLVRVALEDNVSRESFAIMRGWKRLNDSVGCWAMARGICIMSDRPREMCFDDQDRLHSETGAAIKYADGTTSFAWHGTFVPRSWILDKENVSPETVLFHRNAETRRAGCEILGWHNILKPLYPVIIDDSGDPLIGKLVQVSIPQLGQQRFLHVHCGTGREFAIPVPPDSATALEAQAWTWGLSTEQFLKPEIRT